MTSNIKKHWETVYETKTQEQVSWTQKTPKDSLDFIQSLKLNKDASIIDIGGGDSFLVDFLLADGYTNISVLDISSKALERAKDRLGINATKVTWIVSNIIDFKPEKNYDVWHDRAAFHFLTKENDIKTYVSTTEKYVSKNLIIGTFSNNGPLKCSGLEVSRYSENSISDLFNNDFELIKSQKSIHNTPFSTSQEFLFSQFKKK